MGTCGMFFDPPYGVEDRDTEVYHHDSTTVAKDVNKWVAERGKLKDYRIVLCGYYEEHENLIKEYGWTYEKWSTSGGYANISQQDTQGKTNKNRETIFYSPYCLDREELFSL